MTQKKQKRPRKLQNEAELVVGGGGDWIITPEGKFYDQKRKKWVLRCHGCKKMFYAERIDAKTHSDACRKAVSRRNLKGAHREQQSA